eukprot:1300378-Amphidinium_carterae.1
MSRYCPCRTCFCWLARRDVRLVSFLCQEEMTLGVSMWDFACAIQQLSKLPMAKKRLPLWSEVWRFVRRGCSVPIEVLHFRWV